MAGRLGPSDVSLGSGPVGLCASLLLLLLLVAGGGGAQAQWINLVLESLAAALLVAAVAAHLLSSPIPTIAWPAVWLLVGALLLILLQLVPLPFATWSSLPGRELARDIAVAIGAAGQSRPLSLNPEETRLAAIGLIVPAAVLLAGLAAPPRWQLWAIRAVVLAATLSAVLGALQVASGGSEALRPYREAALGVPAGLMASRNVQCDLLIAGIIAAAMLIRLEPGQVRLPHRPMARSFHFAWLLIPLFALMTAATESRAGIALLLLFLPVAVAIALGRTRPAQLLAVVLGLVVATGALLSLSGADIIPRLMTRFEFSGEMRFSAIEDILYTLRQYWPVGSGLGTFVAVFNANEDLDKLGIGYLNNAHNDFLEVALETGLAGVMLMALALLWLGWRLVATIRATRRSPEARVIALGGFLIIALLLLHSLADYPLRFTAPAALFGAALVFLIAPSNPALRQRKRRRPRPAFGR